MTEMFTLGRDAEVRKTPNGKSVCDLALAYQYGMKDASTGKKPTQWVQGALWGQRAESLAQYLTKGTKVVVTLESIHINSFTKQDGTASSTLRGDVIAITLAGSPQAAPAAAAPPPPPPRPAPVPVSTGFDDMDSDVPF
jgi:single-strand DNA-binding protein